MAERFRVAPDGLQRAATGLEELADRLESEAYGLRQSGVNAATVAGNGLAASAVRELSEAWTAALGQLVAALRRDAGSLREVASGYEQADAQVEQEMRQLLAGLSP